MLVQLWIQVALSKSVTQSCTLPIPQHMYVLTEDCTCISASIYLLRTQDHTLHVCVCLQCAPMGPCDVLLGSPNLPVCQCVSQSVQTLTHLSACTAVRSVNICAQIWPVLTACRQPRSGSLCMCQALGLGNRGTTLTPTPIAPSMEEPL